MFHHVDSLMINTADNNSKIFTMYIMLFVLGVVVVSLVIYIFTYCRAS